MESVIPQICYCMCMYNSCSRSVCSPTSKDSLSLYNSLLRYHRMIILLLLSLQFEVQRPTWSSIYDLLCILPLCVPSHASFHYSTPNWFSFTDLFYQLSWNSTRLAWKFTTYTKKISPLSTPQLIHYSGTIVHYDLVTYVVSQFV